MNKRILSCQRKEGKLYLPHFCWQQWLQELDVEDVVERTNALKLDEPEVSAGPSIYSFIILKYILLDFREEGCGRER